MEMAETITPEADKGSKRRTGRSPAYPFMSVQKAIDQAYALHLQEGEYAAPLSSAVGAWGYGAKSSGGRQTLATMKYYGLIDVSGEGDGRKVKVSDIARRILLDQREDDTEKRQLIRRVALTPAAHKALYEAYPNGLASDGSVHHFLVFDQGFKPDAATDLLAEFKETASYIGLYEPQKTVDKGPQEEDGDRTPPTVKVGDRIQATVNGEDVFPKGAKVLGFSEDGAWVFTDQAKGGVRLKEVTVLQAAETPASERPNIPASLLATQEDKEPLGTRKAIFPLKEGDVSLVFPEDLSETGLNRLKAYLEIFLEQEIEDAKTN